MANDPIQIRYAAMMTCISDYFTMGWMGRTEADLSATDCINAIRRLAKELDSLPNKKDADNAWGLVTNGKEGIKVQDLIAFKPYWSNFTALYHYTRQKYDMLAIKKLKQLFVANGGDIFRMGEVLHIYPWKLTQIMEYRQKIPKSLMRAIMEISDQSDVTWEELAILCSRYSKKKKED